MKSKQVKGILNEEQITLAAKFLAATNTGLVGCGFEQPTNKSEIDKVYSRINYEYENELGEGLSGELKMWKKEMEELKEGTHYYDVLKKEVPFIFE